MLCCSIGAFLKKSYAIAYLKQLIIPHCMNSDNVFMRFGSRKPDMVLCAKIEAMRIVISVLDLFFAECVKQF